MSKNDDRRPLSLEETVELLGAEAPQNLGPVQLHPLGMKALATQMAKRLVSKGGRPTDETWDIARKVPMKSVTWEDCRNRAEKLREYGTRVAAGQVAAIYLELGLRVVSRRSLRGRPKREVVVRHAGYQFLEGSEKEAELLCAAINAEGLW